MRPEILTSGRFMQRSRLLLSALLLAEKGAHDSIVQLSAMYRAEKVDSPSTPRSGHTTPPTPQTPVPTISPTILLVLAPLHFLRFAYLHVQVSKYSGLDCLIPGVLFQSLYTPSIDA